MQLISNFLDLENTTEVSTVDENTHEFVTELTEPGKYKLTIRTFSSSGSCPTRESDASKAVSFYISKLSVLTCTIAAYLPNRSYNAFKRKCDPFVLAPEQTSMSHMECPNEDVIRNGTLALYWAQQLRPLPPPPQRHGEESSNLAIFFILHLIM